jgi:flagellar biosynthesis/type III secretory pathway chaperone
MTELFDRLAEVLTAEEAVLQSLVASAERETSALVEGDHDGFLECVREQEGLLARMQDLERHRAEGSIALADAMGASRNAPLLGLCDGLPTELAERGRGLHDRIQALTIKLSHANRENDVLIRQALHQTQHTISLLTGIAEQRAQSESYAPVSQGRAASNAAVLDKRA